jgi:4a-hydroxytetrahydrobiopterin dehydratase
VARREKLSDEAMAERLAGLSGWKVEDGWLTKRFRFKQFMDGIRFVNQVAAVAEEMDHHPDIYIRFGLITISLKTHEAQGITETDFAQAARLDGLV